METTAKLPQENPQLHETIRRDFGEGFAFRGFLGASENYWRSLETGKREDLSEKFRGCSIVIFTGGVYPKVVRLSRPIPTFDSGDRQYDSWHDLHFVPMEGGKIKGLYSTGGYELVKAVGFQELLACPPEVEAYLK